MKPEFQREHWSDYVIFGSILFKREREKENGYWLPALHLGGDQSLVPRRNLSRPSWLVPERLRYLRAAFVHLKEQPGVERHGCRSFIAALVFF